MIKHLLLMALLVTKGLSNSENQNQECLNAEQTACTNFCDLCSAAQTVYIIIGENFTFPDCLSNIYEFQGVGSDVTDREPIPSDGRYIVTPTSLTVPNVTAQDEGLYICLDQGVVRGRRCLNVLGTSRFASCDNLETPVLYDPSFPGERNSCFEEVTAEEGPVQLNTQLVYTGSGVCGCVEFVMTFIVEIGGRELFTCNESPGSCSEGRNGISVQRITNTSYDFDIIFNLTPSDSGEIFIELRVRATSSNTIRKLFKVFDVNITQGPTTDPPTTSFQTTSSTRDPGTSSTVQVGPVAGGTVAAIIIVALIIALLALGLVFVYKKSMTETKPIKHVTVDNHADCEVVAYKVTQLFTGQPSPAPSPQDPTLRSPDPVIIEEQVIHCHIDTNKHYSMYGDNIDLPPQGNSEEEFHT